MIDQRRRRIVRWATPICSLILGLLACEIIVRLIDGVPFWPPRNLAVYVPEYDPLLGWRNRANLQRQPARWVRTTPGWEITTGAFGFRMNSDEIKPLDSDAVLVVGDSFALGAEVTDRETYAAQLAQLLKHPVLNAGIGGFGTDQMVLAAEQFIPLVKPSLLIVSIFEPAIEQTGYQVSYGGSKPWFDISEGKLRHHNNPVPSASPSLAAGGMPLLGYSYLAVWIAEHAVRPREVTTTLADNDPVAITCMLLKRLKTFTDTRDIPMLVFMLHGGSDRILQIDSAVEKPHPLAVANCAVEAGIETLDLWEPTLALARSDPQAYYGLYSHVGARRELWGHFTPSGNAFAAAQIAQRMRSMGWPAR